MGAPRRVLLEPAWLLHQRPFRESGRILELYTRDHGRVTLFARGVRGGGRNPGAVLQAFVPLLVSWSGSGDGGRFTAGEPNGPPIAIAPKCVLSGFYLNELLLKLLAREDPHPDLYEAYGEALGALVDPAREMRGLRLFEKRLLEGLGLGVDYSSLVDGGPIDPTRYYHVHPGRGVTGEAVDPASDTAYRGAHLLALAAEDLRDEESLAAARRLMRGAIAEALEGRPLESRRVARALKGRGPRTEEIES
jgi:DNA repair protein RecO (recombination protein O)